MKSKRECMTTWTPSVKKLESIGAKEQCRIDGSEHQAFAVQAGSLQTKEEAKAVWVLLLCLADFDYVKSSGVCEITVKIELSVTAKYDVSIYLSVAETNNDNDINDFFLFLTKHLRKAVRPK